MSDVGTPAEGEQAKEDRFAKERRYLKLYNEKVDKKKRIKEIDGDLEKLNEEIREAWAVEGVKNIPLDGQLLHLKKEGWVKVKGLSEEEDETRKAEIRERAIAALKDAGYEVYVSETYNAQTVSSLAREEHWDQAMPEGLEEVFEFEPDYKVAVRKQS